MTDIIRDHNYNQYLMFSQKKAKAPKVSYQDGSHTDSVLGMSWCQQYRNVLASASADKTVKVWDISRQVCEHTLTHHTSKVQSVEWNPLEAPVLLSGSFDKSACLVSNIFRSYF